MSEIPVWEKYMLTPEEARDYFGIGVKKIKQIIENNPNADFVFRNGVNIKIKRKKFEEFIDRTSCV